MKIKCVVCGTAMPSLSNKWSERPIRHIECCRDLKKQRSIRKRFQYLDTEMVELLKTVNRILNNSWGLIQAPNKSELRRMYQHYKGLSVSVKFKPAHPSLVAREIMWILETYKHALNKLGLRMPKESNRKKIKFPKRQYDYPSKIISRCEAKLKRRIGQYLRGRERGRQRMALLGIIAEEFENLRASIKSIKSGNANEGSRYIDAMDMLDRKTRISS